MGLRLLLLEEITLLLWLILYHYWSFLPNLRFPLAILPAKALITIIDCPGKINVVCRVLIMKSTRRLHWPKNILYNHILSIPISTTILLWRIWHYCSNKLHFKWFYDPCYSITHVRVSLSCCVVQKRAFPFPTTVHHPLSTAPPVISMKAISGKLFIFACAGRSHCVRERPNEWFMWICSCCNCQCNYCDNIARVTTVSVVVVAVSVALHCTAPPPPGKLATCMECFSAAIIPRVTPLALADRIVDS